MKTKFTKPNLSILYFVYINEIDVVHSLKCIKHDYINFLLIILLHIYFLPKHDIWWRLEPPFTYSWYVINTVTLLNGILTLYSIAYYFIARSIYLFGLTIHLLLDRFSLGFLQTYPHFPKKVYRSLKAWF